MKEKVYIEQLFCSSNFATFDLIRLYMLNLHSNVVVVGVIILLTFLLYIKATKLITNKFLVKEILLINKNFAVAPILLSLLTAVAPNLLISSINALIAPTKTDGSKQTTAISLFMVPMGLGFALGVTVLLIGKKVRLPFYFTVVTILYLVCLYVVMSIIAVMAEISIIGIVFLLGLTIGYVFLTRISHSYDSDLMRMQGLKAEDSIINISLVEEPINFDEPNQFGGNAITNLENVSEASSSREIEAPIHLEEQKLKQYKVEKLDIDKIEKELISKKETFYEKIHRKYSGRRTDETFAINALLNNILVLSILTSCPSKYNYFMKNDILAEIIYVFSFFLISYSFFGAKSLFLTFITAATFTIASFIVRKFIQLSEKVSLLVRSIIIILTCNAYFTIFRFFINDAFFFINFYFDLDDTFTDLIVTNASIGIPLVLLNMALIKKNKPMLAILNCLTIIGAFGSCFIPMLTFFRSWISGDLKFDILSLSNTSKVFYISEFDLFGYKMIYSTAAFTIFLIILFSVYCVIRKFVITKDLPIIFLCLYIFFIVAMYHFQSELLEED